MALINITNQVYCDPQGKIIVPLFTPSNTIEEVAIKVGTTFVFGIGCIGVIASISWEKTGDALNTVTYIVYQ